MKTIILTLVFALFSFSVFSQIEYFRVDPPFGYFGFERYWDKEKSLYGYQKDGKVVIEPKYVYVGGFSSKGLARVRKLRDKQYPYQEAYSLYFDNEGLDGFIDTLGNVIIPIEFGVVGLLNHSNVAEFSRGKPITIGRRDARTEKYGLINDKGEIILEPTYDFIVPHVSKFPFVLFRAHNFSYGENGEEMVENFFLDAQGEILAPNGKYDFMDYMDYTYYVNYMKKKGFYYVEKQGMAGVINDRLEVVLPLEYEITDREATKKLLFDIYHAKKKTLDSLSQEKDKSVK